MRRAIIHIGMPRTASTTIQHVMAHHRTRLAEHGVLYPDLTPASARDDPQIGHQHLAEALDGRRPRAEAAELLAALSAQLAVTDADTVLLSYEDWSQEKHAGTIAASLNETFARHGFRPEAVAVLKPQAEHLNSSYAHRTQLMQEKRLFAAYCRQFQASRRFAYAALIEPWHAACQGRMRAVPLRDRRSDAPLLHRFLRELELDRLIPILDDRELARVENRSPGPHAAEVSRRLRLLRVPQRLPLRPRAAMREIEKLAFARGLDATPFKGLTPALRATLDARYATANDALADTLWGTGWNQVVQPERPIDPNEIGGHAILPETEAVLNALMAESCAMFRVAPAAPWYRPVAELATDLTDVLHRRLRLSRRRVI